MNIYMYLYISKYSFDSNYPKILCKAYLYFKNKDKTINSKILCEIIIPMSKIINFKLL